MFFFPPLLPQKLSEPSPNPTHLVDKQHPGHELRAARVDVAVDDAVDLGAQLVGDLRLPRPRRRRQRRGEVGRAARAAKAPAAGGGPRVGRVEVVERDVLDHLAPLVHVALGQRDVLVGLEVEAAGVGLAAAEAADRARGGLEVDDVAVFYLLLLFSF